MVHRVLKIFGFVLLATAVIACGPEMLKTTAAESDPSNLHFVTFGPGVTALVAKVKQPTMSICLSGTSSSERQKWSTQIKGAVLKWVEPMRAFTRDRLVRQVEVRNQPSGCDAQVVVHRSVHANTRVGKNPTVNMAASGHFGSYGVLLHEFGHAFALGDTYVPGGVSGQCQSGQPQSVMCNVSYREPQEDDVKGLKVVYDRIFPDDEPGGEPPQTDPELTPDLYLGLSAPSQGKAYVFAAAVEEDRQIQELGQVLICVGSQNLCQSSNANWQVTTRLKQDRDVNYYRSEAPLSLQEGGRV